MLQNAVSPEKDRQTGEDGKNAALTRTLNEKLSRLFRGWRHRALEAKIKRRILRLEKKRLNERTEMITERRLYERLFKRRIDTAVKKLEAPVSPRAKQQSSAPLITSLKKAQVPLPPTAAPLKNVDSILPPAPPYIPPPINSSDMVKPTAPITPFSRSEVVKPLPVSSRSMTADQEKFLKEVSDAQVYESAARKTHSQASVKERSVGLDKAKVPVPTSPVAPPAQPAATAPVPKPHRALLDHFFASSLVKKLAHEREEEKIWQERNEVEKRFWQAYAGVKPNLVKNQASVFFNWHEHFLLLILSMVISCLVVALIYVGLLVWQKERMQNSQPTLQNTQALEAEIDRNKAEIDEIIAFNDKLGDVAALLDNHVYWTSFLTFLENNTLRDVYYESFSGDLKGEYVLPAAARSLEAVSLQLEVLKGNKKQVRNVNYDLKPTGDNPSAKVLFNLGLNVDTAIFLK